MNKELCFIIEGVNLYYEQALVEYNGIPIFFLCRGEKNYYLVLCTDIDDLNYIIVKVSMVDVYDLLHGIIPMRDVILKQKEYWNVVSGAEIVEDIVVKKNICLIETDQLPEEKAFYKILTNQIELFVKKFDSVFFASDYFSERNKIEISMGIFETPLLDAGNINIVQFNKLIECKTGKNTFLHMPLYAEYKDYEKISEIKMNFEITNQSEMFKMDEVYVNTMAVAV